MDHENMIKYLKYKQKYLSLLNSQNLEDKDYDEQLLDLMDLKNSQKYSKKTTKESILAEKQKIAYALMNMYEQNPSSNSPPFVPNAKLSNH